MQHLKTRDTTKTVGICNNGDAYTVLDKAVIDTSLLIYLSLYAMAIVSLLSMALCLKDLVSCQKL